MKIVGIDPGITGAVCIISHDLDEVHANKMPIKKDSDGKHSSIDSKSLYDMLIKVKAPDTMVVIESQHSFFGMSMPTMFTLGETYGAIKSVVEVLFDESCITKPTAKSWQSEVSKNILTKKERDIVKNEETFNYIYPEIKDAEFAEYLTKRTSQKGFKFTKLRAAYLYYKISNLYNIKSIKYSNHNIIDSFLIAYYGKLILDSKKIKAKIPRKI